LIEHNAIEQDDVLIVVRELGVVAIVRRSRVWLQMPMRGRPGMVGVSLMDMLRRQRRQGEIRHQDRADDGAAEGRLHLPVIMVTNERCVKQRASNHC
jgi:hypothetical protein